MGGFWGRGFWTNPGATPPPDPAVTIADAYIDGRFFIAHRGAPLLYPENTAEAYRACVADGILAIEQDVRLTSDGVAVVMHDTTIDRTCTTTGTVSAISSASWASVLVDGDIVGGEFAGNTYAAPFFEDIVAEFGNQAVLVPQAYVAGSGQVIVDLLVAGGVSTSSAIVQSFDRSELDAALTAGYPAMWLAPTDPLADIVADGIEWVGYANTVSAATVTNAIAAGLKVVTYTSNRHNGEAGNHTDATGYFSDDPLWLAHQCNIVRDAGAGHFPILTADPFADQTWQPGMLTGFDDRGSFMATDAWGYAHTTANYQGALQGWMCPVGGDPANSAFTLDFSVKFNSAAVTGSWVSVFIGTSDRAFTDRGGTGIDGYHFLMRKDGRLHIYEVLNDSATQLGTGTTGTTIADGTTATFRITVTATQLKVERTDVATTYTVTDSTYRGGYVTFGRNGVNCEFRDVTVTDT